MPESKTIVILQHLYDDVATSNYLLKHIEQNWLEAGHRVTYVQGLRDPLPAADIVFMHVDLTRVPMEYQEAVAQHPVVINRDATDIAKPLFSQLMIQPEDQYSGPVIVKTKNNYGGLAERDVRLREGTPQLPVSAPRPWRKVEWLTQYPVFSSAHEVPPGVWRNEHLIVERFLPEHHEGSRYALRIWICLGDQEIHYKSISNEPIIKSHNTLSRDPLSNDDVPEELRAIRARLGIDYGKFDYGLIDGKPVLYDVNKTPGAPRELFSASSEANVKRLSQGLAYFLG